MIPLCLFLTFSFSYWCSINQHRTLEDRIAAARQFKEVKTTCMPTIIHCGHTCIAHVSVTLKRTTPHSFMHHLRMHFRHSPCASQCWWIKSTTASIASTPPGRCDTLCCSRAPARFSTRRSPLTPCIISSSCVPSWTITCVCSNWRCACIGKGNCGKASLLNRACWHDEWEGKIFGRYVTRQPSCSDNDNHAHVVQKADFSVSYVFNSEKNVLQ